MILLWGISADQPLALVFNALQQKKAPVLFLDQLQASASELELHFNGGISGNLTTPQWSAELSSFHSVYVRPYDTRNARLVQSQADSGDFEQVLLSWIEMTPALVVNRPSAMSSNNSKPYQLQLIRDSGFNVPDTLVTTDPQAAREFWKLHGSVIYKSVSGVRSIVRRLSTEHESRLDEVAHCPTQFQEYIDGTDYRVHVVSEQIFACEITSSADDYRHSQDAPPSLNACEVPREIAERCRELSACLNLAVAGIDLRRTRTGEWYCFEVNPSPGFSFYEHATGQPIAEAIADLLLRSSP